MAGFVFAVPVPVEDRIYAAALLRYVKRRADKHSVAFNFAWNAKPKQFLFNHYYISINGDLILVEIFTRHMIDYCDGFSEGYKASDSTFKKSLTPTAFAGSLYIALERFHKKIEGISDLLRSEVGPFNLSSITFKAPKASGLQKSMTALTECFLGYFSNRATSEQVAEQIHSSSEHLMRKLIDNSAKLTYAQLVDSAKKSSLISIDHATSLIIVKNLRRNSKHRAQNISEEKLGKHFQQVIGATHSLLSVLRQIHTQQGAQDS